jgi:hypothetical protein
VSSGVQSVLKFRPRHQRQSPRVRLRLWWHRVELDEQLAAGAQPLPGTLLAARAEQLGSRHERHRLAQLVEKTLREADKPAPLTKAGLPLRRREIRACSGDIAALIRRLEDDRPIDVQGAAMTNLLLFDGTGPLYRRGNYSLRFTIRRARLALDHVDEPVFELREAA